MMTDQLELSIIIPAFNEAEAIGPAMETLTSYCLSRQLNAELIVSDDGSRDDTVSQARRTAETLLIPTAVLTASSNAGKGAAVRRGMLKAQGKLVLFCDADLATPIKEFEKFRSAMNDGADIAIGTRKVPAAVIVKRQSWIREHLGRGFTTLTNIMLGTHVSDITCGFKCFRYEAAQALFARQLILNWSFDSEILFLARRCGYKIREIPVTWHEPGSTKVKIGRDIVGSFIGLIVIRWNLIAGRYR